MNTVPTAPEPLEPDPAHAYPVDDEGYEHPHWCRPDLCTAPSMLRARNVNEADVPLNMRNAHLGGPEIVDGDRMVETRFTLQAWRMVDQPVTDEVEGVDLRVETKDERLAAFVFVTVEQLDPLTRAFAEVRDIARTGRPPTRAQRAIRALYQFGVLDSGVAARVLPMYREHLTRAEVEQVVDWFVGGTDEFRRDGAL